MLIDIDSLKPTDNGFTLMSTTMPAEAAFATTVRPSGAEAVADALNAILADFFALYLKTKNFHWHVSGPHFRDYHLLLDAQAAQIFASTDGAAERVRKIGGLTLRSIGDIARHQRIKDNDAPFVGPGAMLAELREDNAGLTQALRAAKAIADNAGDNATSALIDEWTDQAEERAWFLLEAGSAG